MEIINNITRDKITLVICDYISKLKFDGFSNICSFVDKKMKNNKKVIVNNINIDFYELNVEEVINNFLLRYNLKGRNFINKVLNLSTLSVDYLTKDPYLLKDSEKFKLLISLALCLNPSILVIENLSCFLDNKSCREIMNILKKLKREYDKTIVIIDNDIDYFYTVCDDVLVINNNKIITCGKKNVLYDKYDLLKKNKIPIPTYIEFIKYVKNNKHVDVLVRDDVKDIMKDIYRCL